VNSVFSNEGSIICNPNRSKGVSRCLSAML